jgi:hypothetical protein
MADSDTIRLSYIELADRLGIKPHAARMKAKRAADRGLWRIIPGNHPNDRVMVELPASALTQGARAEGHRQPAQSPGRAEGHDSARDAVTALHEALATAQGQVGDLLDRLAAETEARRHETAMLAATEAREMALEGEIVRLSAEARRLAEQLDRARLPWWRKV